MKNTLDDGCLVAGGGCGGMIFLVICGCCITGVISAIFMPYSVNFLLEQADKPPAFTHLHGFVCGLFPPVAAYSIIAAIIVSIATLFV